LPSRTRTASVHRDLKPENVMVGPFGEVLVMDWGVAQLGPAVESQPTCSDVVGTRAYMPPEQTRGAMVDARADVFALGSILDFLVTGTRPGVVPFRGPRTLQAICRKACAPEPGDRYHDVRSLAADVDCFLACERVSANDESVLERLARFSKKHRVAILMIAAYPLGHVAIAWFAP
jgi:serine/threonine protein kinase